MSLPKIIPAVGARILSMLIRMIKAVKLLTYINVVSDPLKSIVNSCQVTTIIIEEFIHNLIMLSNSFVNSTFFSYAYFVFLLIR